MDSAKSTFNLEIYEILMKTQNKQTIKKNNKKTICNHVLWWVKVFFFNLIKCSIED